MCQTACKTVLKFMCYTGYFSFLNITVIIIIIISPNFSHKIFACKHYVIPIPLYTLFNTLLSLAIILLSVFLLYCVRTWRYVMKNRAGT